MIISASYRTDIPAFYSQWFLNRLAAGFCNIVNPWGGQVHRIDLTPAAIDGFVFWTRNMAPLRPHLDRLRALGPIMVQFTLTGYPRPLETSVIDQSQALDQIRALVAQLGPGALVWRYDPVLVTDLTPAIWHCRQVAALAAALEGLVDEVVFSVAHIYRKTRRNLDRAAARHGFAWQDPDVAEKQALLTRLAERVSAHGIRPTLCAQPELRPEALAPARCIDAGRLSAIGGYALPVPVKGKRPGCFCHQSRDVGAYDTCPHGCTYCYAVGNPDRAAAALRRHDPYDAFLAGPPASPAGGDTPKAGGR